MIRRMSLISASTESPDTFLQPLEHGITVVDTGFHRADFDAAYLLVSPEGRAAFIDTGHNAAVPRLLAALDHAGLGREAVDWVIPTHVHLDHAGGAGLLMANLPNAQALIHPRGARHLVNPLALVEGARAVYGPEEVLRTYGHILLFDDSPEAHGHGKILGGGMVGTHAGDMIGEIALAIEMGADAVDIGKTIHPHPTLGESIGMAAEVAHGSCTDLPPAKR